MKIASFRREAKSAPLRRVLLFALLCLSAFLFLRSLQDQNEELDGNRSLSSLLVQGRVIALSGQSVVFERCIRGACEKVGETHVNLPAPAALETAVLAHGNLRPNRAVVTFPLGPEARRYLAGRRQAALVLVRSVQERARGLYDAAPEATVGIGQNVVLAFETSSVLSNEEGLRVVFDFPGLTWFGPAEIPPVLTDLASVDALTSIPLKLTLASRLSWQLELGFPLLLAAVGLVLDHSAVFGLACVYAVARALRSFLNVQVASGALDAYGTGVLALHAVSGACVVLFVFFVRAMCRGETNATRGHWISGAADGRRTGMLRDMAALLLCALAFALASLRYGDFVMTSDLWSDALSSVAGASLLLWVSGRRALRGDFRLRSSAPLALLLVGLVLTGTVNMSEIVALHNAGFKNPLDWRHVALFPLLLTTALFEVGSTSKRIAEVSRDIEEKTRLDAALRIAESIHGRMFPPARGGSAEWNLRWRAISKPATELGGDWHDLRILGEGNPGTLVGCVVDLTGHGIGPSLAASALCTRWREIWARPGTHGVASTLGEAALAMHQALCSLSAEETATACFFAVESIGEGTHRISWLTCAHPGLMLQTQDGAVVSLHTHCGGLGLKRERFGAATDFPVKTREVVGSASLCAFSDGLCTDAAGISSWSHRLAKRCATARAPVPVALLRALRDARRDEALAFAKAGVLAAEVDDKTLVVVQW